MTFALLVGLSLLDSGLPTAGYIGWRQPPEPARLVTMIRGRLVAYRLRVGMPDEELIRVMGFDPGFGSISNPGEPWRFYYDYGVFVESQGGLVKSFGTLRPRPPDRIGFTKP
jgi:hypothetical protein